MTPAVEAKSPKMQMTNRSSMIVNPRESAEVDERLFTS
jgi:hypothetical protein